MRGLPMEDLCEVTDERGNSLDLEDGEYGVGGLSASEEQTLVLRRT